MCYKYAKPETNTIQRSQTVRVVTLEVVTSAAESQSVKEPMEGFVFRLCREQTSKESGPIKRSEPTFVDPLESHESWELNVVSLDPVGHEKAFAKCFLSRT